MDLKIRYASKLIVSCQWFMAERKSLVAPGWVRPHPRIATAKA